MLCATLFKLHCALKISRITCQKAPPSFQSLKEQRSSFYHCSSALVFVMSPIKGRTSTINSYTSHPLPHMTTSTTAMSCSLALPGGYNSSFGAHTGAHVERNLNLAFTELHLIDTTSYGRVYKAHDRATNRAIVIKAVTRVSQAHLRIHDIGIFHFPRIPTLRPRTDISRRMGLW